jgi:hypothetical protein
MLEGFLVDTVNSNSNGIRASPRALVLLLEETRRSGPNRDVGVITGLSS